MTPPEEKDENLHILVRRHGTRTAEEEEDELQSLIQGARGGVKKEQQRQQPGNDARFRKMSKLRVMRLLCFVIALASLVGTWTVACGGFSSASSSSSIRSGSGSGLPEGTDDEPPMLVSGLRLIEAELLLRNKGKFENDRALCSVNDGRVSLSHTVSHLTNESASWVSLSTGERLLRVSFQTYDTNDSRREYGGDEFVVSVSGWDDASKTFFKAASVTNDWNINGTYSANLAIPTTAIARNNNTKVRVKLLHYYDCQEQIVLKALRHPSTIDFRPVYTNLVVAPANVKDAAMDTSTHAKAAATATCKASQEGIDQVTTGFWRDEFDFTTNCTNKTPRWVPLCKPPTVRRIGPPNVFQVNNTLDFKLYRIGDSTMSPTGGNKNGKYNFGMTYSPYKRFEGHHATYIELLFKGLSEAQSNDVLVLGQGLHQLLHGGYHPQTAAMVVLRMLCQLSLVFPGKMVVQGPVPIQQHLSNRVDMTDLGVNLLKATLRTHIHRHDGRLAVICSDDSIGIDLFTSGSDEDGAFASRDKVEARFERNNYNSANLTEEERILLEYFQTVDRDAVWGDRMVVFADPSQVLRPRPECYRDGEKIHAQRWAPGGYLQDRGHGAVMTQYAGIRALMPP